MSNYNILATTDTYLTRLPVVNPVPSKHYYPSEASVISKDSDGDSIVLGACQRASYFRVTLPFGEGERPSARMEYIFAQGKMIENWLVEQWKRMGIFEANSVRFQIPEYNISGELDVVIREPPPPAGDGKLAIVEIKTIYGYNATKEIFGNKSTVGQPKPQNLLQTLIYLYAFQDKFEHAKLIYVARDNPTNRREFRIELSKDSAGILWPVIDGQVKSDYSVQDILKRYQEL